MFGINWKSKYHRISLYALQQQYEIDKLKAELNLANSRILILTNQSKQPRDHMGRFKKVA